MRIHTAIVNKSFAVGVVFGLTLGTAYADPSGNQSASDSASATIEDAGDSVEIGVGGPDESMFGTGEPPFALGWNHAPVLTVVSFGRPFGVSTSYAGVVGPNSWCAKPVQWETPCLGLMSGAEIGLGGGRIGFGGGFASAGRYHFGLMASLLRAWASPPFYDAFPVGNYQGLEAKVGYDIWHVSAGAYRASKVADGESAQTVYTWSLGAGF